MRRCKPATIRTPAPTASTSTPAPSAPLHGGSANPAPARWSSTGGGAAGAAGGAVVAAARSATVSPQVTAPAPPHWARTTWASVRCAATPSAAVAADRASTARARSTAPSLASDRAPARKSIATPSSTSMAVAASRVGFSERRKRAARKSCAPTSATSSTNSGAAHTSTTAGCSQPLSSCFRSASRCAAPSASRRARMPFWSAVSRSEADSRLLAASGPPASCRKCASACPMKPL
ncbi:hypothetical protein ACOBQX_04395 [Actinokineospora sp. G85]|uniref:hypothetical protein n=1 Tax=Actinokineospora sp. G85 TaxID=3406626 RepID=UPI003C719E2F